jgi:DNA-binding transcriptional ArsR family regulator
MENMAEDTARYADMMSAMGAEPRLRIMRLLLSALPGGMVVGEIQERLGIPASTLSHHLEKLKVEGLVAVRRERQYLRVTADADALRALLSFLYEECCARGAGGAQTLRGIRHDSDRPKSGCKADRKRKVR